MLRGALGFLEEALALTRQLGDRARESDVLGNLGMAALAVNQLQRARQIFEQELNHARATKNHLAEKITLERLAITVGRMGDHPGALALFEKALPLARLVGDRQQEANLLWYQGIHHAVLGQRDLAVAKAEEAIAVFKLMGKPQAAWYGAQLQKYRMGVVEEMPGGPSQGVGTPPLTARLPGRVDRRARHGGPAQRWAGSGQADQWSRFARHGHVGHQGHGELRRFGIQDRDARNSAEATRDLRGCEHHTGMRCKICGCFTAVKSGMLHEDCPIGKWPA